MATKNHYNKEFICGKTNITRDLLESLPEPFNTENVSDKTMQDIANKLEEEMKDFYQWEEDGSITPNKVQEKWWEYLESMAIRHNVPYYYE